MTKRYKLKKGTTTNYFYDNVLKQNLTLEQVLSLLNLGVVRVDGKWPILTTKHHHSREYVVKQAPASISMVPLDEDDIQP